MAAVYRARHLGLGKDVALKLLDAPRTAGDMRARFEREARAAARLDHPGCVRVLDTGSRVDGSCYIAMELLEGPTLSDRLARLGRFSPDHAVDLVIEMLDALAHAHRARVLHRDIKPANVMFTTRAGREHAVLIDFGLARLTEEASVTATGTCVGSPSYVAPERLLEQPYDERADLYSMAILLYELVGGRRPFVGTGTLEILRRQVQSPPPPLAGVPAELEAVITRCLAKDPDDRYPSAEAFCRALLRVPVTEGLAS